MYYYNYIFFTHCVKPKAAQVQINSIVNSNIQGQ